MSTVDKYLKQIFEIESKFFVDIGCSCSTEYSQSEILLDHHWSGLMFEYDRGKYEKQLAKMKDKNVKVIHAKVTPENILQLLESNNCVEGFYLTIDIDGYDYFVLEQILSKYKPKLIVSEINEKIPPGIKFSVLYNENYGWDSSHFYGYSLSMLENLLVKYNYKILDLDYNNVVLTQGKQTEDLAEIYNRGYLHKDDRFSLFGWNSNFEPIYKLNKQEQINFINKEFSTHEGKYTLS